MTLAVALQLRDRGLAAPYRTVLISPWLDVTLTAPDIPALAAKDHFLAPAGLVAAGELYRGELPAEDPRVSPINGDFSGLGPITLFSGTHDILHSDAKRFVPLAKEAGVSIDYHEAPGMLHVYPLFPIPEAKQARQTIIRSAHDIVYFFWDNFGWGELGCYGGGVLRGAPTPRIDALADEGLKLLNHNVEAQCTPSRSATMTGRHAIRSGTGAVALTGSRRNDPLGDHDRAGALRRGLRDRHVGQVAPRQRSRAAQPGRLRVRRGGVVPAHRGRGLLADAVVLPRRGRDGETVRRRHQDHRRAAADLSRARRAPSPRCSRSTTPSGGRVSTARSPNGRATS